MDNDLEFLQEIFPNIDEEKLLKSLQDSNGDVSKAMLLLIGPNQKDNNSVKQRTFIKIHPSCQEISVESVKEAIKLVPSSNYEITDSTPEYTISISFQENPCKPLIFIEPDVIDLDFFKYIEPKSIVLTKRYNDIEIKSYSSYFGVIVLPFTKDNIVLSVRFVLIENGIIGDGYGVIPHGDIWHEMLRLIPMISENFSETIMENLKNPYSISHSPLENLTTKNGNKLPQRILNNLKLFYTTDDPNNPIETGPRKKILKWEKNLKSDIKIMF